MAESNMPKFVKEMRKAADCAVAAMDVLVRDLRLSPDHPVAEVVELQREIILSLSRLSEIEAELGERQTTFLDSPEMMAAIHEGIERGARDGLKLVAREMRRRTVLHLCLVAGMVVLGSVAFNVSFTMGSRHKLAAMAADCVRHQVELTPAGDSPCAALMPPR